MNHIQVSDCDGCGSEERWILHNTRHRGIYCHLCTSCVLKFHSGSFCSVCYQVFDLSSLPKDRIFCLKCSSIAHLDCVKDKYSSSFYLCPPCSNPSFSFFDVESSISNEEIPGVRSRSIDCELVLVENRGRKFDLNLAKVFVAATRIASASMSKAATVTGLEAESRLKDAVLARKGANEALEWLVTVSTEGKVDKEKGTDTVGLLKPVKDVIGKKKKKKKKKKKTKTMINAVDEAVAAREQFQDHIKVQEKDRSGKIEISRNNVDSIEKDREKQDNSSNVTKRDPNNRIFAGDGDRPKLKNSATVKGNDPSSLTNGQGHIVNEDTKNNGLLATLSDTGHLQHFHHGTNSAI